MVNKKMRKVFMVLTLCLTMILGSSMNAYAYVDESAGAETTTEAVTVEEELTAQTEKEETGEITTESEEAEEETGENVGIFSESGNLSLLDDVGTDKAQNLEYMTIMDDAQKQEYESSLKEEPQEVPEIPIEDEPTADEPVDEEPQADLQTNNLALFGVIGVIAALVIGGYAFMKKKAKKDGSDLDEDLEFYDDEEYENEDEQEPEFAEEEDVD